MRAFEDVNLTYVENARKFSNRVEKNVGKGEIANYVLTLPNRKFRHFQTDFELADDKCADENSKMFSKGDENAVGKGEIA